MKKSTNLLAATFAATALISAYLALGIWGAIIFAYGIIGGFAFWIRTSDTASWKDIRISYCVTIVLFIAHKIEEKETGFFPALSELTGVPLPSPTSLVAILLNIISLSWLAIPFLMIKKNAFRYFLACAFFTSMGITELAHFIFPLLKDETYAYFPGMITVIFLAPSAWIGMYQLLKQKK